MRASLAFLVSAALCASACILDFAKFEDGAGAGGATGPGPSTGGAGGATTTGGAGPTTVGPGGGGGIPAACENNIIDGSESDVDCGGAICPACPNDGNCNGAGDCASGFCDGGTCAACTGVADCPSSAHCDGGVCLDDKDAGEPCSEPSECVNDFCVDGVCCDGLCGGFCEGCTTARTGQASGLCAPILPGTDPDLECSGQVCNGAGVCADVCGLAPTPPGGTCPAACTSCNGGTCVIECTNQNSCAGDTVSCPPGWACQVACTGNNGCSGATIECPEGYACNVSCSANSACAGATVSCASGECSLQCGNNNGSCSNALLSCGGNTCTATCSGGSKPNVSCDPSCTCTPCP